jgi:hypothetical protein
MQTATHNGLGIYVNEMQRSINGLGHYPHAQAGGIYDSRITPYGYWRAYHPSDARGQFGGFGTLTDDQLKAFDAAMDGCAVSSTDSDKSAANLAAMLKAFPDPADRVQIQQYLATHQGGDPLCLQAVNYAFARTAPPSAPVMSSYTKKFYIAIAVGAAVLVGSAITVGVVARRRRKGAY